MLEPNGAFDHEQHLRMLANVAGHLRRTGEDGMSACVERARMIHIDMMSRHASAVRVDNDLGRLSAKLHDVQQQMDSYVLKPNAPWLGYDLWPKDPEHKDGSS